MRGIGTIINVLAILLGGGIGYFIKSGLKPRFQEILTQACGVATIFIGITGALPGLLQVNEQGGFSTQRTLLLVFSLVFGGFIGEALNIELRMDRVGESLKSRLKMGNDNRFVEAFVTATLVVCVGAMAIVGSIQDGLLGDPSMLITKSLLDFVIVIVFTSSLGIGAMFSAIPLGIYQGGITLFAILIATQVSDVLILELSSIGSVLIFCVGVNLCFGKRIRVGNLLPAILIPVVYRLILYLLH